MTQIVEFDASGVRVHGEAAPRSAPAPAVPHNDGDGDVRKGIVPNIKPPPGPSATTWERGIYVSLAQWLDGARDGAAILLQPADNVTSLEGKLDGVSLVSVDFPRIGDGRGYTHAQLLRQRLNYRGRLRALGAVTADQVCALARVGFDSFALRADQDAETAVAALKTFSVPYQGLVAAGKGGDRAEANFVARVCRLERQLAAITQVFEHPVLSSSLSAEDMVIIDAIARLKLPIGVITIDTNRLHAETLALISEVKGRYGIIVDVYHPNETAVGEYVAEHGVDGFYNSLAQRKRCCEIRKVEPMDRALRQRGAWITGQRREQASTRENLLEVEYDARRAIKKFNPLATWNWADVLAYAARYAIPMNPLYARGYISIGCAPCTKPVRAGENPRNGRWWWENQENKECGLHTN